MLAFVPAIALLAMTIVADIGGWNELHENLIRPVAAWVAGGYLLAVVSLTCAEIQLHCRDRRAASGCCVTCGYNLTGNVSGICPECGTPILQEAR